MKGFNKADLEQAVRYDENSPTGLVWVNNSYGTAGEVAGVVPEYRDTPFIYYYGGKVYTALVVWVLHGRILTKGKSLAAKDGNLHNVRIENLQEVVLYQNPL